MTWRVTFVLSKDAQKQSARTLTSLKDKGIAFNSKAKKSELVQIFNTNTKAGYIVAYGGCFPKRKLFYFAHSYRSCPRITFPMVPNNIQPHKDRHLSRLKLNITYNQSIAVPKGS